MHCEALINFAERVSRYQGQIKDNFEGGAKPRSGSVKQGVWGHGPPEAIGC